LMCTLRCGEPRYLIPFFWLIIAMAAYGFAIIILEVLKKMHMNKLDGELSNQDKTKVLAKNACISWVILCLLGPIIIWKILTRDPEPTWYWHRESLTNRKYVTLTSLNPSKVFSPGGLIKNARILGGPIHISDFLYTNGIFATGDSEIEFNLNGKFNYLETEIGIEQNADLGGEVAFNIWADGVLIFPNQKDAEQNMNVRRYGEAPIHIRIFIGGSKTIMLQTIGRTGGNRWRDRGVWGGPIVSNN
jgi:hypothetical protein